ncbi:MAG: HEPN domain-containing protein [Coriobacteriales bacterium]|nr:HEPN domain-containing protein [Coriobacteriales bacterium]
MRPDPIALEDARAWLSKAELDVRAARVDISTDPPLTGDAGFHCQQAVEKAFKAILSLHDIPFRKTHDLSELSHAVLQAEPGLKALAARAIPLTAYAWEFWYPGDVEEPPAEEVVGALAVADGVVSAVANRLSSAEEELARGNAD